MNEKFDNAITKLLAKFDAHVDPDKAQKYSQSALNLAHAKQILCPEESKLNKGGGKTPLQEKA